MRTSKFVAGVGVLAVVTVVGLSAPFAQASVPPADRASGTGSAAASSACKPLTARSTRLVGADGHQVAATATTAERSKAARLFFRLSRLTVHRSPFTLYPLPFTVHRSPFMR